MSKTFNNEKKKALVEEWLQERAKGIRQKDFAFRSGISARRLREFCQLFGPKEQPIESAKEVIRHAIEDLERLLESIDSPSGASNKLPVELPMSQLASETKPAPPQEARLSATARSTRKESQFIKYKKFWNFDD